MLGIGISSLFHKQLNFLKVTRLASCKKTIILYGAEQTDHGLCSETKGKGVYNCALKRFKICMYHRHTHTHTHTHKQSLLTLVVEVLASVQSSILLFTIIRNHLVIFISHLASIMCFNAHTRMRAIMLEVT